jgi:hypothetical protein
VDLDHNIPALFITALLESLAEGFSEVSVHRRRAGLDESDLPDLPSLLYLRDQRLECEAENDREPDPPHRHLDWDWLAGV